VVEREPDQCDRHNLLVERRALDAKTLHEQSQDDQLAAKHAELQSLFTARHERQLPPTNKRLATRRGGEARAMENGRKTNQCEDALR
jgi:hypothetical protein